MRTVAFVVAALSLFTAACERHALPASERQITTTIDDLNTEQALSWITAPDLSKVELSRELSTTRNYRFRNVFSTDKAYCGEFATQEPSGTFGPSERFFRRKQMAAPAYPE